VSESYELTIQRAVDDDTFVPEDAQMIDWLQQILQAESRQQAVMTVRIVNEEEMQTLNRDYRHKDKTTNVLSFAVEDPYVPEDWLGDIAICAQVVNTEAQQQNKQALAHWAHMLVHGTLHLLGYDHIEEDQAERMESREIAILKTMGFTSPYESVID
jgi:probable rRNA maturation factor